MINHVKVKLSGQRSNNQFRRYINLETYEKIVKTWIKGRQQEGVCCPHCGTHHVVRYGKYRDRQRYKCKDCCRTFNDLTNTPLHWTHNPHKWMQFLQCMLEGYTLRRAAYRVGVTWVTLFYWRHKLIRAFLLAEQRESKNTVPLIERPRLRPVPNYICVREHPPIDKVQLWECRDFKNWIAPFEWIASKFIDRYVAWFRCTQKVQKQREIEAMKELLFRASSICSPHTYELVQKCA